ncbi:HtaA domain-containing protein [Sanguibacter sp. HDW7]|uniref:HtaA domain-containing protein n=1 Tax=Sanguibacter sp. HDW7 TaxID=2714931 RepID=UPI00140CA071|nr:HtaA domain-containing protein [Sanguibacter sp. HDW7]QIK82349.1 hypothetical protein G7063_01020 [Sanguibacter sp. HDW7]
MRTTRPAVRRRLVAAFVAAGLGLGGLASGAAPAVAAKDSATTTGTLSWGVKSSLRSYVARQLAVKPAAQKAVGSRIVLAGGTTFAGASTEAVDSVRESRAYRFPTRAVSGASAATFRVASAGTVTYHQGDHFTLRVSGVEVRSERGRVSVVGDVRLTAHAAFGGIAAGTTTTRRDVRLATAAKATRTAAKGRVTVRATGLAMTAAGARAFGDLYAVGTPMDDLTVTFTSKARATQKVASKVASSSRAKVAVRVTSTGLVASGKVTVTATRGSAKVTRTAVLRSGRATVTLPHLAKGTWKIRTTYGGSATVTSARTTLATLKVL